MTDWLYICENCGDGCSNKASRIIESGPHEGERWCVDCISDNDPMATY